MGSKTRSISTTILVSFLAVIFLSLAIQIALWVNTVYSIRSIQRQQSEGQYLQSHKMVIKHEVDQMVASIADTRRKTELRLKNEMKKRVNTAYAVAFNIYSNNVQQTGREELRRMVSDALMPLLSSEKSTLYILATGSGKLLFCGNSLDGEAVRSQGCSDLSLLIQNVATQGEGYSRWQEGEAKREKVIFAKYFQEMDLIIGTGFLVANMTAAVQEEVLEEIDRTRYGVEGDGYLFAFQYDGKYLSHIVPKYIGQNLLGLTDPNGVQINREIVQICKSGGGYVEYAWDRYKRGTVSEKISYVKGYGDWQWAIGTGFYLDDLEQVISEQKQSIQSQFQSSLLRIGLFSILIFLLSAVIVRMITGRLNEELSTFHEFFNAAALRCRKISLDVLKYHEFYRLAESANIMLTKREAAEEALILSEERFRQLVADLPKIAVQGYDSERKVIYWNRASELIYGYGAQEALGNKLEDLIIPEAMREAVVEGVRDWYENGVAIPAGELLLRHKNGTVVPVYSSHVMLVSSQGERTMYCIDMDMAELKLAQEKGQKTEGFYRGLFEHSTSGVAVYEAVDDGMDFIFKEFNSAGEEMDGVSREDLLGHRVTEMFPSVEEFGMLDVFRQVWRTGIPVNHAASCYDDGNRKFWRENNVYKLPTGEVVAVYDDITKEKELEIGKKAVEVLLHRAQKMEAIGLMAGGVAHDLNNILTGLTGYPDILLMQLPKESELREPIEAIKESGQRAAAVVADLLTVARGVASTKNSVHLNDLVTEYFSSPEWLHLCSLNDQIRCDKQLEDDLPPISCSAVHVKKCIMNLAINAMESMEQTGTISFVTTSKTPERAWAREHGLAVQEYVVFSVTDTGSGIAPEDIEHIFEPFYSKKVMGRSGTGLGLAVVWNTMEDHQGKVLVQSSDKGTCFELYFPLGDGEPLTSSSTAVRKHDSTVEHEHILVVDDEALLRDVAAKMLGGCGYQVDMVASGEEALLFLKESPVDLVILDMLMGTGMNGYETYREILSLFPEQKALIVSGFSESDDVKAALDLGAGGFVKKPYSLDELVRGVQMVL